MNDPDGPHRTTGSASQERSTDDGAESIQRAVPDESLFTRPMLDFGEDWTKLHVRRSGLSLPAKMSFASWQELGCRVALVANCSAWWLGDWLVYGEQAYGDRYEQAIANTELDYQTLRNYAWVARKLPMSRRRDTLSFGHHTEVAALPDDEQDAWLARAEQLSWSCNKLRRALRTAKMLNRRPSDDETSVHSMALRIDVPSERHHHWQSAAEQQNCSVADWIIATLDRAANEELSP